MTTETLTDPQYEMLRRAAAGHDGECWVRRGQAKTATRLEDLGLGSTYQPNSYSRKFAISESGLSQLRSRP